MLFLEQQVFAVVFYQTNEGGYMEQFCPITPKSTTEQWARTNALFTVLILSIAILTKNSYLVGFLLIDFVTRGWIGSKYSLLCILSKWLVGVFTVKTKKVNAGPKIFAAQIGSVLSAGTLICFLAGMSGVGCIFASTLLFFSFLEGVFGFCVACKLYPFVSKIFVLK